MRPVSTFYDIQLSNSREISYEAEGTKVTLQCPVKDYEKYKEYVI